MLVDCRGKGSALEYGTGPGDSTVAWSEWAPGLWLAVASMLGRAFRGVDEGSGGSIKGPLTVVLSITCNRTTLPTGGTASSV